MHNRTSHKYLNVSAIIPVYNDQTGIDTCLAALAAQTYPKDHYEVVVVDNASSPPIKIGPQFSGFARLVVCHTPGSYAARNAGIAEAQEGAILAFIDADCVPDRDWIKSGVEAFDREGEHTIIGGEVAMLLPKHPTAVEQYQLLDDSIQRANIEYRGFAATANLFAAKAQIKEIGLFNESLLSGGDLEWSWRAAKAGFSIKYAPEVVVCTAPRKSLVLAVRQARRVAGGRYALRHMLTSHIGLAVIKPHRSASAAAKFILSHPNLTPMNRIRVFFVATIIKVAQLMETVKLTIWKNPERR